MDISSRESDSNLDNKRRLDKSSFPLRPTLDKDPIRILHSQRDNRSSYPIGSRISVRAAKEAIDPGVRDKSQFHKPSDQLPFPCDSPDINRFSGDNLR